MGMEGTARHLGALCNVKAWHHLIVRVLLKPQMYYTCQSYALGGTPPPTTTTRDDSRQSPLQHFGSLVVHKGGNANPEHLQHQPRRGTQTQVNLDSQPQTGKRGIQGGWSTVMVAPTRGSLTEQTYAAFT
jgi:hypothetical protein